MVVQDEVIGVVGGSGFIGSRLVELLRSRHLPVRVIDKQPSTAHPELWQHADIRDREGLLEACRGCTVLYNLAAEHRDDVQPVSLYEEVNVGGTRHLVWVAERLGIERILFTSTVAVYGLRDDVPDETFPTAPFNPYGHTKLAAERVLRAWVKRGRARSLTVLRPTAVFGPGNRGNIYLLLAQITRGRSMVIGDGSNRKSMAYVDNVAGFLAHALAFGPGAHLYNYVDKPDIDMNELVALVGRTLAGREWRALRIPYGPSLLAGRFCDALAQITGRPLALSSVRVRKYAASTRYAAERLAETGFVPQHDLREALAATIRHEFGSPPFHEPVSA